MKVVKRDGTVVPYAKEKIFGAIGKAFNEFRTKDKYEEMDYVLSKERIDFVTECTAKVDDLCQKYGNSINVETIQDFVDIILTEHNPAVAKLYRAYRRKRTKVREANSTLMKAIEKVSGNSSILEDEKRSNANIDGDTAMGTMLQIGSEASKGLYLSKLIPEEFGNAHINGDIHIHDLDFYKLTETCCQIDLKKLFKDGFDTGHGHLREPQSINSAAALAAIAIQANQNDQHGGQSIPEFDYYMAPYVKKSYEKNFNMVLELTGMNPANHIVEEKAWELTKKDTYQAMEGFVHNLNSMHSRAGAQVPFSSINYGTDTSKEGRLVMEQLLLATEAGLGNGETPIFPIQILKVKEGVNLNEGDPNYDIFQLACRVSAKRLFPNFSFLDAPFNKAYLKEGNPDTEVAYMGAARGDERVSIRIYNYEYNDVTIAEAYEKIKKTIKRKGHNPNNIFLVEMRGKSGVYKLTHTETGLFYIGSSTDIARRITEHRASFNHYGTLGDGYFLNDFDLEHLEYEILETCDINDLYKVESKYVNFANKDELCVNQKDPICNGNFTEVNRLTALDGKSYSTFAKKWTGTRVDYVDNSRVFIKSRNQWVPVRAILKNESGCPLRMCKIVFEDNSWMYVTEDHPLETGRGRVQTIGITSGDFVYKVNGEKLNVKSVEVVEDDSETYDFTTDNDMFDLSGIISHNCRTRTIANNHDKSREVVTSRGNLSFTTINLPRLAIEADGNIPVFFSKLTDMLDLVKRQLLERFRIQCQRHPKNYPFLMGQGVWMDSEKLGPNDDVTEILKHGSLSIGFIGLAETLVKLTGHHHGETEEAQQLGIEIVKHMRTFCDMACAETKMNFALIGTPAEGLAGRFTKMDKKRYGIIPGVTDKEYYTNSNHIPVGFKISAAKKIELEAPYHNLTNGGHICYVEYNGDPTNNLDAFVKIVKHMAKMGIGYGAINHPVDRCLSCGYSGIIDTKCPKCGQKDDKSHKIERLRRITGYLVGTLDRWNDAKRAEEHDRVKHS